MKNAASPLPPVQELHGLPPSADALRELDALRQAVGLALDRKRRLGQYAVVWQDGEVREVPPEALPVWPSAGADADRSPPYELAPLATVVSTWEPLPEGCDDPENPLPQAREPL